MSAKRAVRALLLLRPLSAVGAMCHMLTKPCCLLRSVSALAVCHRAAMLDMPTYVSVRNVCAESRKLLRTVSTDIKSAVCHL
ncbi:hypothetical protein JK628_09105 [Shewanella sp. KX20019]|uniref:hypothetical protein n=1 Tax=Shewanella sp. KX20019 TaxID=2803864 RepID=UPI0019253C06|nr:hypothetical protein [Shewanella sp. KX20019]QQX81947.1 hypothetical protein JK628_09105 [Shewanella sp. KX20019]